MWTAARLEWVEANYMFRGVLLPAGKHAVRFRYQPKSFRRGATISGLALAALLAGGFIQQRAAMIAGTTQARYRGLLVSNDVCRSVCPENRPR